MSARSTLPRRGSHVTITEEHSGTGRPNPCAYWHSLTNGEVMDVMDIASRSRPSRCTGQVVTMWDGRSEQMSWLVSRSAVETIRRRLRR
jgi:hypothetical protein